MDNLADAINQHSHLTIILGIQWCVSVEGHTYARFRLSHSNINPYDHRLIC